MAATYGSGSSSPPVIGRPVERVLEEAQTSGQINLSGRKLKEYPKICVKYDLADTIIADLSKNRLQELPSEICDYHSIERINCYGNCIKSIPPAISHLHQLTYLELSRNQLTVLPSYIGHLQSLEVLIAANNKLVSLPEELGMLEKLHEIDVSCNEISHLPVQIGDLTSLRSFNIRRNLLVELPLEISRLNLRKIDFSNNRIEKIPTAFRKIETLEEIILDNNPLMSPTAHICTKGRKHIMKYLHIEAIKEERKRGILHESEMKRLARKSLPPQQTSDEFRSMVESPDSKWKRHTVLSSDSGYSTTDSLEKCGWSQSEVTNDLDAANSLALKAAEAVREHRQGRDGDYHRRFHDTHKELQRQKSNYDRQKKLAEQIRIQQEDAEREECRRAAIKLQEEQKILLEKQRDEQKHREEEKLIEESRRREEETRRLEDVRRHEEDKRRQEEISKQEELQRKSEESKHREEVRLREDQKTSDIKKPKTESNTNPYPGNRLYQIPTMHDGYNNATYFYPPPPDIYQDVDYTNNQSDHWDYRKTIQSSNSLRDEKKNGTNTPYRRTVSDSVKKPASTNHSNNHIDNNNYINRNGVGSQDSINSNSSSNHSLPPGTTKHSTPSPATSNPSIARLHNNDKKSTPTGSPVVRRAKVGDKSTPTPTRTTGRTTPNNTTPRSSVSTPTTKRSNNITPPSKTTPKSQNKSIPTKVPQKEEEFKKKHQALQTKHLQESQTLRKRLEDTRTTPGTKDTPTQKRVPVANSTTTTNNSHNAPQSNRNRSVSDCSIESNDSQALSTGTMKLLEEYKDSNPNFTIRRHHEQQREEIDHLDQLRQTIESRLKVTLPDNLPDALRDGVVLCHLANQIRPRSVASIHVPSPAVPKLTMAKCRRNVENFLEACRKIGVRQDDLCACDDIIECVRAGRLTRTVQQLTRYPRLTNLDYVVTYFCLLVFISTLTFILLFVNVS